MGPDEPSGASGRWADAYGRGDYDPHTGLYEWYEVPDDVRRERSGEAISWETLLEHWALIEADLHDVYGVDVEDRGLMRRRTWRWLQLRITGLLAADTRLYRALAPEPETPTIPGLPG